MFLVTLVLYNDIKDLKDYYLCETEDEADALTCELLCDNINYFSQKNYNGENYNYDDNFTKNEDGVWVVREEYVYNFWKLQDLIPTIGEDTDYKFMVEVEEIEFTTPKKFSEGYVLK